MSEYYNAGASRELSQFTVAWNYFEEMLKREEFVRYTLSIYQG